MEQIKLDLVNSDKNRIRFIIQISMTIVALLLIPQTQEASAQTGFEGSLKGISITDAVGTNSAPTANFIYTQNGDTFEFDATASSSPDTTITQYKWDFGDGNTATGVTTSHTYNGSNSFPVTLTLTDSNGSISISQNTVSNLQLTVIDEQTIQDSDTGNISEKKALGQGFYLLTAGLAHSITLKTGPTKYGSPPARIRIGTSKDLSSTYLAESNEVVLTTTNSEYEFVFTQPVALNAQTQYYFTVSVTNNLNSNYIDFIKSSGDSYKPSGCPDCKRYYSSAAKWNADGIAYIDDLYFEIIQ